MKRLTLLLFTFLGAWQLLSAQCTEDCVWPGDLNENGIANNLDILALGFALGETGPARANMTTNWEALEASDWAGSLPGLGTNFKHCDANGDGEVTSDDQFVVNINYNRTNSNFTGLLGNDLVGDDLFLVPQNTVATPGGSYFLDIHLGTSDNPINDIYGIGFQLAMDTQYVETVNFDFSDSWIGTGNEIFTYGKYSDEIEHAGTAITRVDGVPVSGFGKIARMEIVITDVVLGLDADSTACLPFFLDFKNVLGINEQEDDLLIRAFGDSLTLKDPSQLTATEETIPIEWSVFPNPAQEHLYIKNLPQDAVNLTLYNQMGQSVLRRNLQQEDAKPTIYELPIKANTSGFYLLEIKTQTTRYVKKVLLNTP